MNENKIIKKANYIANRMEEQIIDSIEWSLSGEDLGSEEFRTLVNELYTEVVNELMKR